MKRFETASEGSQVITSMVHIHGSDCYLLIQEIKSPTGELEVRNTITLSRDDIEAMADEAAEDKPHECRHCAG